MEFSHIAHEDVHLQGTWQFMSVPCLLQEGKAIEIADELESFLHVLIYDASRFVSHNLTRLQAHAFYRTYFDGQSLGADGNAACSLAKRLVVRTAELTADNVPIVFGDNSSHPLNDLVSDLLTLFQSRLVVYLKETSAPTAPQAVSSASEMLIGVDEADSVIMNNARVQVPLMNIARKRTKEGPKEPTPEMLEMARKLETHRHVMMVFAAYLAEGDWPKRDTHEDDLMEGYDQDESLATLQAAVKKSRADHSQTACEKVKQSNGEVGT